MSSSTRDITLRYGFISTAITAGASLKKVENFLICTTVEGSGLPDAKILSSSLDTASAMFCFVSSRVTTLKCHICSLCGLGARPA
ncbi:MAG: hypothetical protein U5N86_06565, partial [Planctomycetota bacterium]|nr:hypothetical protein [Planctomycetota bacterium]